MSIFKLISRPLGTVQCFVLQRNDGAEFEILSGYGGGLNAWRIPVAEKAATAGNSSEGKSLDLLYGYREGDDIFKMGPDTNAGCRLTPYPGRTAYAQFTWNGSTYKLINNVSWAPHALHGFLQNQEWKFESFESNGESCTAVFTCDWPGAFAGFPFPFRATNTITFTGETVTVTSNVKNTGKKDMPYSEGWHPYFSLGEKIDSLTLTLPKTSLALLDSADLPTGNFKDDTRFVGGPTVSLESDRFALDIWQKTGNEQYNAIQMYTPPDRMSIAIEPMTSEPDALNHHRGLIVIPPGEEKTFSFGFKFRKK